MAVCDIVQSKKIALVSRFQVSFIFEMTDDLNNWPWSIRRPPKSQADPLTRDKCPAKDLFVYPERGFPGERTDSE